MRIEITSSAPDYSTILSTADLKTHLRVTHNAEDSLIASLRDAACMYIEGYCNTKLHSTTAVAYLTSFYRATFPVGPVTAISEVRYQTSADTDWADCTVLPTSSWFKSSTQPAVIDFTNEPGTYTDSVHPVQIGFTYGHATCPEPLVHGVRLLAAHLYENRQEVTDRSSFQIRLGVEALVQQYRNLVQP